MLISKPLGMKYQWANNNKNIIIIIVIAVVVNSDLHQHTVYFR